MQNQPETVTEPFRTCKLPLDTFPHAERHAERLYTAHTARLAMRPMSRFNRRFEAVTHKANVVHRTAIIAQAGGHTCAMRTEHDAMQTEYAVERESTSTHLWEMPASKTVQTRRQQVQHLYIDTYRHTYLNRHAIIQGSVHRRTYGPKETTLTEDSTYTERHMDRRGGALTCPRGQHAEEQKERRS